MHRSYSAGRFSGPFLYLFLILLLSSFTAKNQDTVAIYEDIGPEGLKAYAAAIGLDECPDLARISSIVTQSRSILEVGGGYGRVIQGVLQKAAPDRCIALEQAENNYAYLCSRFKDNPKVQVIKQSLFEYNTPDRFDLVLWMWSGYADLNYTEQTAALRKVGGMMNDKGILVIDLPEGSEDQCWLMTLPSGLIYTGHLPSEARLSKDAELAGFASVQAQTYSTCKGSERRLYIIQR